MPLLITRVDKMTDLMTTQHVARMTYAGSKTSEDDGARNRQGRENSLREGTEEGEGRLSEVVGGRRRAGVSRVQP